MSESSETTIHGVDIRGFVRNSLNEWEGRVCSVLFTAGCNWRCAYCHGWHFVTDLSAMPPVELDEVFDYLRSQKGWLDGVAVTGGEPTLQPGLADLLREFKSMSLQVKLETNGTHPEVVKALLDEGLLDCLCMDYKAPLDGRLEAVAAVGPEKSAVEKVRETYRLARESGLEREYHTTLCPAYIDEATIAEMAEALEPGGLWVLQQYEPGETLDPERAGTLRYDLDTIRQFETVAKAKHEKVLLRTGRTIA